MGNGGVDCNVEIYNNCEALSDLIAEIALSDF